MEADVRVNQSRWKQRNREVLLYAGVVLLAAFVLEAPSADDVSLGGIVLPPVCVSRAWLGVPCPACGGSRLRPEARAARLGGKAIHEIGALTVRQAKAFFDSLELGPDETTIAEQPVREVSKRLAFMDHVGVDYLTLNRAADTPRLLIPHSHAKLINARS